MIFKVARPLTGLFKVTSYLLCLCLVFAVASCSSNKKKELKPLKLQSFNEEIELDSMWSRSIGSGLGDFYHQFVLGLDEQFIYAASENGKVYQIDKITGKVRWKVTLDTTLTSGVGIDDNQVYVGAVDGAVIALDKKNGQQKWSRKLTSEIVSAPSSYNGHLVIQTTNGQVFDLNTEDGEQRWRYDSVVPALTIRGNSRAQFFANYVVVGLSNGKLVIIDLDNGQMLWEPKIAEPKGDTEIERIIDVDATPLIVDEKLYAVSYHGRLVAYDLKTGRSLWAEDASSFREISTGFGNVYVSSADGIVTAYDQQAGTIKWSNEDFLRRKLSAPIAVGSYLVTADFEGYVHVLSQIDGHIVARVRINKSGVKSPVVVDGNHFYVIANNGKLKAYKLGEEIK